MIRSYMARITRAVLPLLCIAMVGARGPEKVHVTMCIDSPVHLDDLSGLVLNETKAQIQVGVAMAGGADRCFMDTRIDT